MSLKNKIIRCRIDHKKEEKRGSMKEKEVKKVKKQEKYSRTILRVKLVLLFCCLVLMGILVMKGIEQSDTVWLAYSILVLAVHLVQKGVHRYYQSRQVGRTEGTTNAYLKKESVRLKPKENIVAVTSAIATVAEVKALQALLYTHVIDTKLFLEANLTLSKVVNLLKVDKNKLRDYFKHSASVNFKQYINRLRIEYAITIIRNRERDVTVEELSFLCGFNSRLSFYRAFVYFYGFAPSALLKR